MCFHEASMFCNLTTFELWHKKKWMRLKRIIKWRLMRNHKFIHLDYVCNVSINCWPMVFHITMMNIKLSIFLLALLVPTKKNNIKLKKFKHLTRKQKKFNTQNRRSLLEYRTHYRKNGPNSSSCRDKSILLTLFDFWAPWITKFHV
jgi:arginine deiminase